MFERFKLRVFVAKVQAELKAQHNNQQFVNTVCGQPSNIEKLNTLREHAYYRGDRIAPFLATCEVLRSSLRLAELPKDVRQICASLLAQRLQKAATNPSFRLRHISLFGDLEEDLSQWARENGLA